MNRKIKFRGKRLDNGEWYSCDDEFTRNPQMWMPIPPIPDTNTEKK